MNVIRKPSSVTYLRHLHPSIACIVSLTGTLVASLPFTNPILSIGFYPVALG